MPPNRKAIQDVFSSLATLSPEDVDVSQPVAKFPPLTSGFDDSVIPVLEAPKAESRDEIVIEAPHVKDESHPANSYWDWEEEATEEAVDKDALIEQIMEEERVRQLFSVDSIQASLVAEQEERGEPVEIVCNQNEEIEQIMEEERIRQLFSVDNIEANLVAEQEKRDEPVEIVITTEEYSGYWDEAEQQQQEEEVEMITAKHSCDVAHPLQSYWDWDSTVYTEEDRKSQIIANIMEEERIHQLLSLQNLEQQLLQNKVIIGDCDVTQPENDLYWHEGNDVEDAKQSVSYWDWSSASPEEERNDLIQQIVEEEQIREQFMIETIQEQIIKGFHALSQRLGATIQRSETSNLTVEDYSYWDW